MCCILSAPLRAPPDFSLIVIAKLALARREPRHPPSCFLALLSEVCTYIRAGMCSHVAAFRCLKTIHGLKYFSTWLHFIEFSTFRMKAHRMYNVCLTSEALNSVVVSALVESVALLFVFPPRSFLQFSWLVHRLFSHLILAIFLLRSSSISDPCLPSATSDASLGSVQHPTGSLWATGN